MSLKRTIEATGLAIIPITTCLYATGFLVSAAFYSRLGLTGTGGTLIRAEYILVGIHFWFAPMIVASVFFIWQRMARNKTTPKDNYATHRIAMLFFLLLTLYFVVTLAPPSAYTSNDVMQIVLVALPVFILGYLALAVGTEIAISLYFSNPKNDKCAEDHRDSIDILKICRAGVAWIGFAGFALILIAAVYGLEDRFSELLTTRHWHPLLFGLAIIVVICVLFWRVSHHHARLKQYGQEVFSLWAAAGIVVLLLWYLATIAFAHSVYCYLPASRGGGDFTTMPVAVVSFRRSEGTEKRSAVRGCLLRMSDKFVCIAPFDEDTERIQWRRYEMKPEVLQIDWETIEELRFENNE